MEAFKAAVYTALWFEGGGVFNDKDPEIINGTNWKKCGTSGGADDAGGMTKYGIAKAGHPDVDIANLNLAQAVAIYKKDFWDKVRGDQFKNPEVAAYLFDSLCGSMYCLMHVLKDVQKAVGVTADGILGSGTIAAINHHDEDLIDVMVNSRFEFYKAIAEHNPSQAKFLGGWNRRAETFLQQFKKYLAEA